MSESSTATDTTTDAPEATETVDWKAEAEKWKGLSRKQEERAKANAGAAKELEQLRASQMTEAEKIAAEAEQRGRATTLAEVGERLVRAEFRAQAGGRVADLDEALDDLKLSKFLTEDGEPDAKAIAKAVARMAPPAEQETSRKPGPRPDLSQGSSSTMALNGDPLLDDLKSKLGIS